MNVIAKDYQAIAASKIHRPSKSSRKPRFLVYSRNKKGKTRFCATAGQDNILIVDPEDGTEGMVKSDPHVWGINHWEELDDVYNYLKQGKHNYKWVALDGCTKFANMSLRWVMHQEEERDLTRRPGMVQLKDYGKAGEKFKDMVWNFHSLPMGVIYTAQERIVPVGDNPEEDDEDSETTDVMYVPDLPKGARSSLNSVVDVIGRIYTVKVEHPKTEEKVIQRRLWVEPHIAFDTGYRSDFRLPPYLKGPTVPKLVQLLREGKVTK